MPRYALPPLAIVGTLALALLGLAFAPSLAEPSHHDPALVAWLLSVIG